MPPEKTVDVDKLGELLSQALESDDREPLEKFLAVQSNLPGPRMNLKVVETFGVLVGELVRPPGPDFPVEKLEALLDGWAALDLASAPVNQPREILPACAVRAYGQVAAVRPDWWDDEIGKLRRAASSPRWRTREIVAAALQKMLATDWERTASTLDDWLSSADPLVIRAVAGTVAEPPLLKDAKRAAATLALQVKAVEWFASLPLARRKQEDARTLRQALGFTVSVVVAAAPVEGLPWLEGLTASLDPDLNWIARENLKKDRLKKFSTGN
jgi:hypothetical protein